jgi:hypothetical protein
MRTSSPSFHHGVYTAAFSKSFSNKNAFYIINYQIYQKMLCGIVFPHIVNSIAKKKKVAFVSAFSLPNVH